MELYYASYDFHGVLLSFPTIIDIYTAIYYVSRDKCDMVFVTYTIYKKTECINACVFPLSVEAQHSTSTL